MSTKINKKQREKETERQKGNNKKKILPARNRKNIKWPFTKPVLSFNVKNTSRKVLVAFWILCYLVTVICHHQQINYVPELSCTSYSFPRNGGNAQQWALPRLCPPVPNEAPGAPCARGWSQVGSRIWTKRPCSTLLPTSSPPPRHSAFSHL